MIEEKKIYQHIEDLENDSESFEQHLNDLLQSQKPIAAFILSEGFLMLTEEEYDLLWYLVLIISFSFDYFEKDVLSIEDIETLEEKNWDVFNQMGSKPFKEKLDVMFKDYPQEDLLALVEDTLQNDEESSITAVGREIIFIASKTIIDAYHNLA